MKKGSTILRIAGSHMLLLTAAAADQMMKRRVEARFREGEAAILNSHLEISEWSLLHLHILIDRETICHFLSNETYIVLSCTEYLNRELYISE
jgi:hypothetical protein